MLGIQACTGTCKEGPTPLPPRVLFLSLCRLTFAFFLLSLSFSSPLSLSLSLSLSFLSPISLSLSLSLEGLRRAQASRPAARVVGASFAFLGSLAHQASIAPHLAFFRRPPKHTQTQGARLVISSSLGWWTDASQPVKERSRDQERPRRVLEQEGQGEEDVHRSSGCGRRRRRHEADQGFRRGPGLGDEQGGRARPLRALRRDPRGRRHRRQGHRQIQRIWVRYVPGGGGGHEGVLGSVPGDRRQEGQLQPRLPRGPEVQGAATTALSATICWYSPYFSDYAYQPLTYYQAYGGLAGGAQYQVFNGGATTAPTAGLATADPTGLYPYYQYGPAVNAAAAYSMMQYPQMYQYAAVGAPPDSSPTAVSGLHQFIGAAAFEPSTGSQTGGMTLAQLTAPALPAPAPQYQYRLISPMPISTPDQKKPLA